MSIDHVRIRIGTLIVRVGRRNKGKKSTINAMSVSFRYLPRLDSTLLT